MHSVVLVRAGNGAAWTVEVSMVIPRLDRLGPREGINLSEAERTKDYGRCFVFTMLCINRRITLCKAEQGSFVFIIVVSLVEQHLFP